MSRTTHMAGHPVSYTPRSDAIDRHEYGVTKNRKSASTGGGRAWSEEEEAYLLQTRSQKMPYKHIAAYLKKTELACRLHYHQLSHGSNRRKRTTSTSSESSTGGHSPVLQNSMPSPIHEHGGLPSRPVSPPDSAGSHGSVSPCGIQLPSIMSAAASTNTSPRLPTILPKPASMTLALASINSGSTPGSAGTASPTASRGYPTPLHDVHPHNSTPVPMPSTGYRGGSSSSSTGNPPAPRPGRASNGRPHHPPGHPGPLRLDCSALPPPPSAVVAAGGGPSFAASHPVDMARLTAVYNAHRASFWAAVAADYGPGANPLVLEQAWRGTVSSPPAFTTAANAAASGCPGGGGAASLGIAARTPITPIGSPDDQAYPLGAPGGVSSGCGGLHPCNHHQQHHHQQQVASGLAQGQGQGQGKPDKTRISAILGIDANPRSPSEREMVRRLEEERGVVGMGVVGA